MQLEFTFPDDSEQEIPYGYCQCGCGQKTNIANYSAVHRGIFQGAPFRFIFNHHGRIPPPPLPNPTGLCMCGCGKPAPIAASTSTLYGYVRGQPKRFIMGHGRRGKAQSRIALEERFWQHMTPGPIDQCWEWQGTYNWNGYGTLRAGGSSHRREKAHRVSWRIHFGPIPKGMFVCHKCDRPPCCNPHHLFLGTAADNMADCVAKGRARGGIRKLTEAQILEIRSRYTTGNISQRVLAEEYGVSQGRISAIILRKSWAHC